MVKQIALQDWPKGLSEPIAEIVFLPEEIMQDHGIAFEESDDELDLLQAAILEINHTHYALVRYRGSAFLGTSVWTMSGARNKAELLDILKRELRLDDSCFSWIHSDICNTALLRWEVIRQDSKGNQFIIGMYKEKEDAENHISLMKKRAHLQEMRYFTRQRTDL